ncbi:DUF1844 domain-containing protein [bacterium]|nr:MAG: DUF1844 domain-containing protein [bacterium]
MENEKKNVDESWKEAGYPEPDFKFFVTTLSLQATIALGDMPNPVTNKIEVDLPQAKLLIDTLAMLKEKTTGNLSAEEDSLLDNMLYELRMHYVDKTKDGGKK